MGAKGRQVLRTPRAPTHGTATSAGPSRRGETEAPTPANPTAPILALPACGDSVWISAKG